MGQPASERCPDQDVPSRARARRRAVGLSRARACFLRRTLSFAAFACLLGHAQQALRPDVLGREDPEPDEDERPTGENGKDKPAIPTRRTSTPAIVTAIRVPLRPMNSTTALNGTTAGWSCQRRSISGSIAAISATTALGVALLGVVAPDVVAMRMFAHRTRNFAMFEVEDRRPGPDLRER